MTSRIVTSRIVTSRMASSCLLIAALVSCVPGHARAQDAGASPAPAASAAAPDASPAAPDAAASASPAGDAAPAPAVPSPLPSASPAIVTGAGVASLKLSRDDGSGSAGEQVQQLKITDKKFHVTAALESTRVGNINAKFKLIAADTEAGKEITVAEAPAGGLVANTLHGTFELPRDWPAGNYRVEITIDDKLGATIHFSIVR